MEGSLAGLGQVREGSMKIGCQKKDLEPGITSVTQTYYSFWGKVGEYRLMINSKNLFPKIEENWHKLNTYTDLFDFNKLKVVTSDNSRYYKGNTNK